MKNTFIGYEEEVTEEVELSRKEKLAAKLKEDREMRETIEETLQEKVKMHKSDHATTSDEKQKEITEKKVKNTVKINPDMNESSIVGMIYQMYNNKYLEEKKAKKDYDGDGKIETGSKEHAGVVHNAIQRKKGGKPDGQDTRSESYTVTNADKKGNTPAYQNYKKGMKGKDGKPLYKAADHMEENVVMDTIKGAANAGKKFLKKGIEGKAKQIERGSKTPAGAFSQYLQMKEEGIARVFGEGMKQARKNVGASTCWDGYKAKGTKKKNGREVPNCVKEEESAEKKNP